MAVTPQTNTTLSQIAQTLREWDDFVIMGHVSPDGDCLGSQLAMMHALHALGKRARCVYASDAESVDIGLRFLPGIDEMIPAAQCEASACVIVVDAPNYDRIGEASASLHESAQLTITVDHHANKDRVSDLSYVDPDAPSCSFLVWQLAKDLGVSDNAKLAQCAYTGLMTDTGSFSYQNASKDCFSAAAEMVEAGAKPDVSATQVFQNRRFQSLLIEQRAIQHLELLMDGQVALTWISRQDFCECDATKPDAENVVNIMRSLQGVRVACVLREEEGKVRGSLRAKDATDISPYARDRKGGGHKAASGFTLTGTLQEEIAATKQELVAYLQEVWA